MAKFTGVVSNDTSPETDRNILELRAKEKRRQMEIEWETKLRTFKDKVLNKKIIDIKFNDELELHLDNGAIIKIWDGEQWGTTYGVNLVHEEPILTF